MDQKNRQNGNFDLSSNLDLTFSESNRPVGIKYEEFNNNKNENLSRESYTEKIKTFFKSNWKTKLFFGVLAGLLVTLVVLMILVFTRPYNGADSSLFSSTTAETTEETTPTAIRTTKTTATTGAESTTQSLSDDNTTTESMVTEPQDLVIYSKEDWGGKPRDENVPIPYLNPPLSKSIISHTVMKNCYTKECCSENMRIIQDLHMGLQWGDIGYSFIVCNDGNVYEGAGWDIQGAHTRGQNQYSYGVSFNGNFNAELPNELQLTAFNLLMEEGVRLGKINPDYKIFAHRQFSSTNSPGDAFYQLIKTWDRWSNEI